MSKNFMIHTFIVLGICLTTAPPLLAQTAGAQPVVGYIRADEVYTRSGPGQSYYPTGRLKRGDRVTVYRQDPGGWYAIRPPEGSFTWVSARYLKVGHDGLAEVTGDRVAARIGSSLSTTRESISVYLRRGELVELYDPNPKSDAQWYRIMPPPGEFRWISARYIDWSGAATGVRSASATTSPVVSGQLERIADFDTPVVAPRPAYNATGQAYGTGPGSVYNQRQRVDNQASAYAVATGRVPEAPLPYQATDRYAASTPVAQSTSGDTSLRDAVGTLELDFSRMVAEDTSTWEFEELLNRARVLYRQTATAVDRGRLQILAERISRFESIRQNTSQIASMDRGNDAYRRQVIDTLAPRAPAATVASSPQFDGVGRLRRVTGPSWDNQAPTFALVDDSERIRCFISAAPGVDPQRYEGRRVGVSGSKEYLLRQRKHHIMATHIQPLDGTTLR